MRIIFLYILPFLLLACAEEAAPPAKKEAGLTPNQEKTKAALHPPVAKTFDNNLQRFDNKPGVVGVFEIGQMLALTILDSASMEMVAEKSAKAYDLLEKDIQLTGAEPDGPPGQISYNNNPRNFKFECLLLIKKMPEKKPVHSKIVVLEASHMLVYNHYGAYQDLYKSYAAIRKICSEKDFAQSAPVREFYMNDPTVVKDQAKWLTRILLPVRAKKQ